MTVYDEIVGTIPWQFKESPRILAILKAWAKQEEELRTLFEDLNTKVDVDVAEGVNLDRIGDIVTLTRTDAFRILGYPNGVTIDDELYRKCLKFKILFNNTVATYEDIRKGIEYLWEGIHCTYSESVDRPAIFVITLDDVDLDDIDPYTSMPLIIKPGGVQSVLHNNFLSTFLLIDNEKFNNEKIRYESHCYYNAEFTYNGDRTYAAVVEEVDL